MKAKDIVRLIVFLVVASLVMVLLANVCMMNNPRDVMGLYGFQFEEKDSIDVAFIGPSQVYTSYYPALAYRDYGFTGFAIATSAMPGSVYKTAFKQIRETQDPQLYIVELSGFYYPDQDDDGKRRKYLDNIPLYADYRLDAIEELVPEDIRDSYYFPFLKYHDNIGSGRNCLLAFKDKIKIRTRGYSLFKNYTPTNAILDLTKTKIDRNKNTDVSEQGFKALNDTLDYLESENIRNVLFVDYPDGTFYQHNETYGQLHDIIKERGFDYVDWHDDPEVAEEIGLDYANDFYNIWHVNVYGTEKMTRFLGEYITSHYSINTTHSDKVTKEWDDCAKIVDQVIEKQKQNTVKLGDDDALPRQCQFEYDYFKTVEKK